MSSIIEGYNYDIFISYRQKDNKGDRWVSEFVEALKTELESTFKEEISVYFDINPSDYLLETYDVDASLKEKLKCLVFIPVISRTYCDPKSFAWVYEFKAFIKQASGDTYGLKVKLPNGNVTSRILPVQIHDLKAEDKALIENELGGLIRAIEFIFKEAGVNRPLTPKDSEDKNINRTNYRNQINKIANAIDEIISAIKTGPGPVIKEKVLPKKSIKTARETGKKVEKEKSAKTPKIKFLSAIAVTALFVIAATIAYPKLFKRNTLDRLRTSGERISVAVMPFQNMTNDTTWNVWQDGIQDILINSLSNSKEFIVRQPESIYNLVKSQGIVNYASLTPSVASTISRKLDVNIFIYGNIKKSGNLIRLYAQLIDAGTKEVFQSFQVEGPSKDEMIFNIIDSLSVMVRNFLIISELARELPAYSYYDATLTNSPEALRYFIYGRNDFIRLKYASAQNWFTQAISLDSNFVQAIIQLSLSFKNQDSYEQAKKWCMKAYAKRDHMTPQLKLRSNYLYSSCFETPHEKIVYLNELLDFDDQNPITYFNLGTSYDELFQYDKAIPEFEKALEIHKKWNTKPFWVLNYAYLGTAYHKTGQYRKEKRLYEKALLDFPNEPLQILRNQGVLALAEKDTAAFRKIGNQAMSILINRSYKEADKITAFASVFEDGDDPDNAELYFRKALSLEPGKPVRLNNLAYFLVNKNRNIQEGLDLAEKALAANPDDYAFLHSKGWGLFQAGKYQEALDILQKSWELRMKNAFYDHEAFLHLEAAKKAVDDHN
jgi:tetratricopeptide (TPR) repeat protein